MKLINLLEKHDFRLYRSDLTTQRLKENSNTIRIYFDYDNWFEFGINDWINRTEKMNSIRKILTQNLCFCVIQTFILQVIIRNLFKIKGSCS